MNEPFEDDQPAIGQLPDSHRESLRQAIADTPESHPDAEKLLSQQIEALKTFQASMPTPAEEDELWGRVADAAFVEMFEAAPTAAPPTGRAVIVPDVTKSEPIAEPVKGTPRVDMLETELSDSALSIAAACEFMTDFARTLERELADMQRRAEAAEAQRDEARGYATVIADTLEWSRGFSNNPEHKRRIDEALVSIVNGQLAASIPLADVVPLVEALNLLLMAKREKEEHGDNPVYQTLKDAAWGKAKSALPAFLATHPAAKP